MASDTFWRTKLHARLHDPVEQALVLLGDPAADEAGTSRALHRLLGFDAIPDTGTMEPDNRDALHTVLFRNGIPAATYRTIRKAHRWASAADRPRWPMEETDAGRTRNIAHGAHIRWTRRPALIHPLSGSEFDLKSLADTDLRHIRDRCRRHFERLVIRDGEGVDWRKTLLAYWRFGPELSEEDDGTSRAIWPLLPADVRVPDHSIWEHLDLTSAFAGAFTADPDGDAALLALSIGPVQSFIAAARTTSDLWAGSHLLARMSWEATKVVCECLGPDAVLFPRLRGIPQIDVWLRDECLLSKGWFAKCRWATRATDSNPLFCAALPNRFVAVVPASGVRAITEAITARVRGWLQSLGGRVVDRLLQAAGLGDEHDDVPACRQMREQLDGFPEVHWAAVPFSLIRTHASDRRAGLDTVALSETMAPFFGATPGTPCGFLRSPVWRVLQQDLRWNDGSTFLTPNPGVLYPAVYDLVERVLAAAKSVRPFAQREQRGWRCSLTGETEWLTTDAEHLGKPYRKQDDTLWARIAKRRPSWARPGEHLGALPAIKRVWPDLFAKQVADAVGPAAVPLQRFVVSTQTMALAHQIERRLERLPDEPLASDLRVELDRWVDDTGASPVALPHKLIGSIHRDADSRWARLVPGLLNAAVERNDEVERHRVEALIKRVLGVERLETYYALLLMDGDHLGRILSGEHEGPGGSFCAISFQQSLHPDVRGAFELCARDNALLKQYGDQPRAMSPSRHLAVSAALNDFALQVVPEVVEREFPGRVMYAGGDDVMAMLPAADLVPAMQRLRDAYSGRTPDDAHMDDGRTVRDKLILKDGFACRSGRLMRMMAGATASCGAVIAHYQAPLVAVMRELRDAERRAKSEGGRDAFSVTIIKRSGGALQFTAKWGEPVRLLLKVCAFLAERSVSRRAVYHSLVWLKDLPETAEAGMLGSLLGYQFARQTADEDARRKHDLPALARRIADLAGGQPDGTRRQWLRRFLSIAEFLARETRFDHGDAGGSQAITAGVQSAIRS